jgi:TatD DNase family protein
LVIFDICLSTFVFRLSSLDYDHLTLVFRLSSLDFRLIMYIDTHCHLTFPEFTENRAMDIGNAKKAGVKQFLVPGVDVLSSTQAVELANTQKGTIFAAVGFHPYEAQKITDIAPISLLIDKTVVAIGECGLDYHLYKGEEAKSQKTNQIRVFDEHCKLALSRNLPLTMHCRGAFDDFFPVLDSQPTMPNGVIHCFSGGLQEVRMAKERGLYIGLDGNITFSKQLQTIIPEIPLAMILLETDSPYLTPVPFRGTRNEPKYIPLIAQEIARLQNIDVSIVEEVTTQNAHRLFTNMI